MSAKRSWANPNPLMFIGGSEDFLVAREVKRARMAAHSFGRRVVPVTTKAEVLDAEDEADTFGQSVLILCSESPGDEILTGFAARADNTATLVLVHDGEVNTDKFPFAPVPALYRLVFNRPSSRKDREKTAHKFVAEETKRLGLTAPEQVIEALVTLVGDDLGILYHEILKASTLARARQTKTLDAKLFGEVLRPAADADLRPVTQALMARDGVGVTKALHRLRSAGEGSGDPIMLVLRGKGGPADQALLWLQTAHLLHSGSNADEISSRLATPKWAVEKDLIPTAKRWGIADLSHLVANLSRVETALVRGAPNPWNALVSALLLACSPVSVPVHP